MSLDKAIECARMLPIVKGVKRHYAIVLDNKENIISHSGNSYTKSHPKQKEYSIKAGVSEHKCFLHAEIAAIIRSKGRGTKLVVARVDSKGKPLLSKPCKACSIAIKEHGGIVSVEYTV